MDDKTFNLIKDIARVTLLAIHTRVEGYSTINYITRCLNDNEVTNYVADHVINEMLDDFFDEHNVTIKNKDHE